MSYVLLLHRAPLSAGVSSKAKPLRKLEVNEVVALLGAPVKDTEIDVQREGGNIFKVKKERSWWQQPLGHCEREILQLLLRTLAHGWPMIREISQDVARDLDELRVDWLLGDDVWGPRIGEDTDRRLLIGELVEVKSAMQEQSGLKRFRCKALKDGASGWATVIDMVPQSGHGYLELVLFLESANRRHFGREEAREVAKRAIQCGALWAGERQRRDIIAPGGEWREFLLYSAQDTSPSTANPEVLAAFPKTCQLLETLLPGAVAMAKIGAARSPSAVAGTKMGY
eukprot:Skav223336  [mRNA]  locus=scaffold200:171327:189182:+ [translate_table: standard]